MKLEILYEDKHIVVVNKPSGLVVHPDGRTTEPTVVDWIIEKYGEKMNKVGEPITLSSGEILYRPGIVHRLDRDTSGVLAIAKDQKAFDSLKQQFKDRETAKVYNAFVYGEMKEEEGSIERPIARSKKDFRLWSAQRGARGEARDARTDYKLIARTEGKHQEGFSYIEVYPKTGRTHQIRVHMKAINHPVIADVLYAPKRKPALGFKRLALHARNLEFTNLEGNLISVEAPLPEDFVVAEKKLQKLA